MRNFTVGLVSGLAALVGFAGSANASATIDLVWASTGTNTASFLSSGATDTVSIILTAGPNDSIGAGVTIDYSALGALFTVTAFSSTAFTMPLPFNLGSTVDTGTMITNINAAGGLGPGQTLLSGASFTLGTITFQRTAVVGTGSFALSTILTGSDHVLDGTGTIIDGTTTFNGGFAVAPVPEPGTLSLLGMGLGGLYVVGRRSSQKR
jgi:hypothetical protein